MVNDYRISGWPLWKQIHTTWDFTDLTQWHVFSTYWSHHPLLCIIFAYPPITEQGTTQIQVIFDVRVVTCIKILILKIKAVNDFFNNKGIAILKYNLETVKVRNKRQVNI